MAHPKVKDDFLIETLFDVFRTKGYEGTSISDISEAAGLKKASLYHRFPKGKEQMVEFVLNYTDGWLTANVLQPLQGEGEPLSRMKQALRKLNEFYLSGEKACVLRILSYGTGLELFQERISNSFQLLINGFHSLASDSGLDSKDAKKYAENTVIRIQGALVLSMALKNNGLFERVLKDIEQETHDLCQKKL